jgi:tetratricopeptide (TPR) repeat protein
VNVALLGWLLAASGPVMVVAPEPTAAAPESAWIAEAVADILPRQLAELGVAAVARTDRLRAQEMLELPAFSLTRATSIRLAESMGATRLVTGSYQLQGPRLQLSLRILDVERATLSAPITATGSLETLLVLLRGLAWDVALAGPDPPSGSREAFLARRPPPFEAVMAYGRSLSAGDPAAQLRLLREATALAPGYDDAWLALGRLLLDSREPQAALESLERIGSASGLAREARFLRGVALLELGRFAEAGTAFAALVQEDPTPAALNNYGLALLRDGRSDRPRASQVLRRAVDGETAAKETVFNLGFALFCEGEYEAAAFWLRGVANRDSRDTHARLALVWALRRSGHEAEAQQEWAALLVVAPSYQAIEEPEAGRRFERIVRAETRPAPEGEGRSDAELAASHVGRAERLVSAGEWAAAQVELTRAAYLDPYSAKTHRLLAWAQRAQGRTAVALGELRMSLWCREDTAVRLELAQLLAESGQLAEARAEAERVLAVDPGNTAALAILGR